jgi:hypothetical protein
MPTSFVTQSPSRSLAPLPLGPALLLVGVVGDLLIAEVEPGINITLWVAALCWTWWRVRRAEAHPLAADERRLLLVALALGAGWAWRENELLRFLDLVGIAVTFGLLALAARPVPVALTLTNAIRGGVELAGRAVAGWLPVVVESGRSVEARGRAVPVAAVARGLLIAVPTLLLFGALLGSADQAYGAFLAGLVTVDLDTLTQHTLTSLALAWVAAAFVLGARARTDEAPGPVARRELGSIEVVMALGPLNLLFLGFVVFQLPYLFGGAGYIAHAEGVTLAEYAKRGFGELCAVAGLGLPFLLLLESRVATTGLARRLLRILAGTQVALLLVIMASALHRMLLYQAEFGLTEERFFATALIGGIAVTACWFVGTALQGEAVRFMRGAIAGWVVWLGMLHAVNPDRVIVEANIRHAEAGHTLDSPHLLRLSPDAIPAIVDALPRIPEPERSWLTVELQRRGLPHRDLRGWSIGHARAERSLVRLTTEATGS